jgi:glycosyltransferase involved in cell wall biosynthesis
MLVVGDSKVSSEVELIHVDFPRQPGILRYSFFQARTTFRLWRIRNSWDAVWLLHGSTAMIMPIVSARVAGKKAVLVWTASSAKIAVRQYRPLSLHAVILNIVESLALAYSSHVITYGKSISGHVHGLRGRPDTLALGAGFVDLDRFVSQKPVSQRSLSVGFVGRLSPEKGLSNLLRALALLAPEFPQLEAYVVGMGELLPEVLNFANGDSLKNRVHVPGNVGQDTLPGLYGQMRVLVIPSYTEGLPNVMLEAMACGTLVLATKVGAIPDVIEHKVNGFLLEDNSPESIAGGVRAIFTMPPEEIEKVARRAESTVRQTFGLSASVDRYRRIVCQIM